MSDNILIGINVAAEMVILAQSYGEKDFLQDKEELLQVYPYSQQC